MANEQNLRTPSTSEAREMQRKSAAKRSENVKRKRTLREIAEILAEKKISIKNPDGTAEQVTYDVAAINRQYQKAIIEGDTAACRFLADLLGEMKTNIDVTSNGVNIVVKDNAEAERLKKLGDLNI